MLKSADLYRLSRRFGPLPSYVSTASFEDDILPAKGLPAQSFADAKGEYPLFSKAATWVSTALFFESAPFDPTASATTGEQLLKAAKFWGIENDVQQVLVKVASQPGLSKDATTSQDYAMVQEVNGTSLSRYPLGGPETLLKSAESFSTDAHLYPLEWRQATAARLLEALTASSTASPHGDFLQKVAGHGIATVDQLREAVLLRARMLKVAHNTPLGEVLTKSAAAFHGMPASVELSSKTAKLLDSIDQQTELYRHYGRGLDLPEVTCHATLFKDAQSMLSELIAIPGGQVYRKYELQTLPVNAFSVVSGLTTSEGEFDTGMRKVAQAVGRIHELDKKAGWVLDQAVRKAGAKPEKFSFDIRSLLSA